MDFGFVRWLTLPWVGHLTLLTVLAAVGRSFQFGARRGGGNKLLYESVSLAGAPTFFRLKCRQDLKGGCSEERKESRYTIPAPSTVEKMKS